MNAYQVTISRAAKWWMVAIPEIGGLTQARSVREAREIAREYIAVTLDVPLDSFAIEIVAKRVGRVADITRTLEDIRAERARGEQIEREANERARDLAKRLAAENVTVRDIGELMNVSYQRAHQLVSA